MVEAAGEGDAHGKNFHGLKLKWTRQNRRRRIIGKIPVQDDVFGEGTADDPLHFGLTEAIVGDVGAHYLSAFLGMADIHFAMKSEPFHRAARKMVMAGQSLPYLVADARKKALEGDRLQQDGEAHIPKGLLGHGGRGEGPPRLVRDRGQPPDLRFGKSQALSEVDQHVGVGLVTLFQPHLFKKVPSDQLEGLSRR